MQNKITPFNVVLILIALVSLLVGIWSFIQPILYLQIISQSSLFIIGMMISIRHMLKERIVGIILTIIWLMVGAMFVLSWV